jgi:hypothetical protein
VKSSAETFALAQYEQLHATQDLVLFQSPRTCKPVYLDRSVKAVRILIHPDALPGALSTLKGEWKTHIGPELRYDARLRAFPECHRAGKSVTRAGWPIVFPNFHHLRHFLEGFNWA